MDRTGSKPLVKYSIIWIIAAAISAMAFFAAACYEERESQRIIAKVIAEYPQLEPELALAFFKESSGDTAGYGSQAADVLEKYGYHFYGRVFSRKIWYLWIFLTVFETGAAALLCYRESKKIRQKNDYVTMQFHKMAEQLKQCYHGQLCVPSADRNPPAEIPSAEILSVDIPSVGISSVEFPTAEIPLEENCRQAIDMAWEKLRELSIYFEELKEKLQAEENGTKALITDISHQLKTPLASLRISHELLVSGNLDTQERTEFFAQEEQEIHKLEVLMDELLHLSQLECNMIQINPINADIVPTLMEAVNQVYMKAHGKQIELRLEKEPQLENKTILVKHDRKWTAEAFANVLENAVKYSDSNTHIVIRMKKLPMNLLIEVEDEGIGIPNQELHRIYQRFYRGEEAGRLVKEGAGVGLYLTRSILEKQGGTITAKRRQKKGTVFRMTLPIGGKKV